jgi:hypothetical protein
MKILKWLGVFGGLLVVAIGCFGILLFVFLAPTNSRDNQDSAKQVEMLRLTQQ